MWSCSLLFVNTTCIRWFFRCGRVWLFVVLILTVSMPLDCKAARPVNQETAEEDFIDGLIGRRLFPLAVLACEERFAKDALSPLEQANTVVELSRTFAAWAWQSSPHTQAQHWKQANAVLERWLESNPENSLQPVLSRQVAQVALMRGQLALQASQGAIDSEGSRKEALQYLRLSVTVAKKALAQIGKGLIRTKESYLSEVGQRHLQRALEKTISQAWIAQARCFEAGSPDRIHALQQAEHLLLPLVATSKPIDWESRLAQLTCWRFSEEKKNQNLVREKAQHYLRENPPADVQGKIHLELARQLAAEQQYIDALGCLSQPVNYSPSLEAEMDFLELEIILQAAGDAQGSDTVNWNLRAEQQLELIETLNNPYWLQRARALFGRQIIVEQSQHGASILARAAEGLYQAGQLAEAVKAYESAAGKAKDAGDEKTAFELYRAAAMITYEEKKYVEAGQRFRKLADNYPQAPGAGEAHLMAAYNLAQLMQGGSGNHLAAYQDLLEEHLNRWPQQATANRARLWLGRLLAAEEKWRAASTLLFEVEAKSKWYPAAIATAAPCCMQECRVMAKQQDADLKERANALIVQLKVAVKHLLGDHDPFAPAVVAETVDLQIQYAANPYPAALDLIQRGLADLAKKELINRSRLEALQVQALVGMGQYQEALDVLETFNGSKESLIQLILRLDDLESSQSKTTAKKKGRSIAELQMTCFKKLEDFSSVSEKKALVLIKVNAFDRLGDASKAFTMLGELAAEYPEDGQIQTRYADLLIQQQDAKSLRIALKKYREVARRTRPQTQRWFAAKYGEATARLRLGDPQKAAVIIRTTRVLYPDLGGKQWRVRFEKLLAECMEQDPSPNK
jgi:tetratricopeptide (TPR) repeat protein